MITIDKNSEWECECGNVAEAEGFHPCSPLGKYCEPYEGKWLEIYRCDRCGKYYDRGGGEVELEDKDELIDIFKELAVIGEEIGDTEIGRRVFDQLSKAGQLFHHDDAERFLTYGAKGEEEEEQYYYVDFTCWTVKGKTPEEACKRAKELLRVHSPAISQCSEPSDRWEECTEFEEN